MAWNHNCVCLRIISADIAGAIQCLTDRGFILKNIVHESDLSIIISVTEHDMMTLIDIINNRGERAEIVKRYRNVKIIPLLKSRWICAFGFLILIILTIMLPTRVLFFEVKGNHNISDRMIFEAAEKSGITFGIKRTNIKSEASKNALLNQIPELEWVGITTSGCVATIDVKERVTDISNDDARTISNIISLSDGVVESVTVTKGIPLCKPGQAVHTGQVLISGYENCGLLIRGMDVEGEIFAKTIHIKSAVSPAINNMRVHKKEENKKFSIQIGKKLINFHNSSGISPTGCVKMYEKKYLMLPGGFQLPVAWICQSVSSYDLEIDQCDLEEYDWLKSYLEQTLLQSLKAGQIIRKDITAKLQNNVCVVYGLFACREEIGYKMIEENL